jgi:hypothetical protein
MLRSTTLPEGRPMRHLSLRRGAPSSRSRPVRPGNPRTAPAPGGKGFVRSCPERTACIPSGFVRTAPKPPPGHLSPPAPAMLLSSQARPPLPHLSDGTPARRPTTSELARSHLSPATDAYLSNDAPTRALRPLRHLSDGTPARRPTTSEPARSHPSPRRTPVCPITLPPAPSAPSAFVRLLSRRTTPAGSERSRHVGTEVPDRPTRGR